MKGLVEDKKHILRMIDSINKQGKYVNNIFYQNESNSCHHACWVIEFSDKNTGFDLTSCFTEDSINEMLPVEREEDNTASISTTEIDANGVDTANIVLDKNNKWKTTGTSWNKDKTIYSIRIINNDKKGIIAIKDNLITLKVDNKESNIKNNNCLFINKDLVYTNLTEFVITNLK